MEGQGEGKKYYGGGAKKSRNYDALTAKSLEKKKRLTLAKPGVGSGTLAKPENRSRWVEHPGRCNESPTPKTKTRSSNSPERSLLRYGRENYQKNNKTARKEERMPVQKCPGNPPNPPTKGKGDLDGKPGGVFEGEKKVAGGEKHPGSSFQFGLGKNQSRGSCPPKRGRCKKTSPLRTGVYPTVTRGGGTQEL